MLRCFILLLFWGFSSPSTITLLPGSQFKLQCLPESDLMFTEYSWSFSNQLEEDKNKRIHFAPLGHTNEELELNPVEKRHAGTYKCVVRGTSAKGMMKVKRIFKISVIENPVFISWQLFEGDEGETITLSCSSSSKNVNSFDSAEVKWYKVKDTGDSFELKELKPVVRNQRNIKVEEIKPRQVYWASDLKQPDWSITIDSLELDDEDLYQCDIITGSEKESVLMELLVNAAPPPRCLNQSQPWEACPDIDSQSSEAILRESLTEFSLNLYKKINTMEPERNLLFSPISIAMVMSQLLLGTRGETRAELERGLFLPSEFSCVHSEMKKLSSRMKDSLLIANQMLFHPELKLREAFINQTQEFYDSVPQKLTNDSAANVKLINTWVADKTQNRVTELVDSLDSSVNIILLNAVYFIGKWKGTFEVKDQQQFTTLSMELLSVPALYSSNYYVATSYIQGLKAYVAKFTLTGKNSLYVLLPFEAGKNGLDIMEAKLTDKNVRNMVNEMASIIPVESEVLLPKVKLLVNTNLFILLKKLELPGLFSDPNLCGMIDQSSAMPLSDARHSAFLSLTEKGVEAAAASSVSFSRSFNNFHAMRPFVLMVFNEEVNIPLFTGKVLHPDKNE
ncbi:plasma protease C1 inhibitor [Tachysurus fulvidraco]|uniref:plasma protease C1 inhibitor n=1 Tax=Tachysurus fulvidraco TaxID=1234273 RepID=UPI001FEE160E|nr:plasma protease C1 inhibitor [Tachysurus fulvidraco]XP_047656209.1 plasma protease C1 inhibitor [Tachysurus fulvidraco]